MYHDVKSSKNKSLITIQQIDYKCCFDSLWQSDLICELYFAGLNDDKLALLYELNKSNNIAVKTPNGLSKRAIVNNIICQGDPWGPIECSLLTDQMGQDSLKLVTPPYKFKGKLALPLLSMVDDIYSIKETGVPTAVMNGFLNAKTAVHKL